MRELQRITNQLKLRSNAREKRRMIRIARKSRGGAYSIKRSARNRAERVPRPAAAFLYYLMPSS